MTYKVNAGGLFKSCVASYVSEALARNLHCDLSIQTTPDAAPIMCHRLVLASALPFFRRTLTAVDQDVAVTQGRNLTRFENSTKTGRKLVHTFPKNAQESNFQG